MKDKQFLQELFKQKWFRKTSVEYKIFYLYMLAEADIKSRVYIVDIELANILLGTKLKEENIIKELGDNLKIISKTAWKLLYYPLVKKTIVRKYIKLKEYPFLRLTIAELEKIKDLFPDSWEDIFKKYQEKIILGNAASKHKSHYLGMLVYTRNGWIKPVMKRKINTAIKKAKKEEWDGLTDSEISSKMREEWEAFKKQNEKLVKKFSL